MGLFFTGAVFGFCIGIFAIVVYILSVEDEDDD